MQGSSYLSNARSGLSAFIFFFFFFGKCACRPLIAAAGGSSATISVRDALSGKDFLVDPATAADFSRPRSTDLVAANGSSIKTFGKKLIQVSFASGRRFSHRYWITTVRRPILGADFFLEHGLLIDIPQRRLIDRTGFTY